MFEVGKKYYDGEQTKGHRDNLYECVAVNNSQQGWMRRVGISERCVTFDWDQGWVEHKEPRKIEFYVNFFERDGDIRVGGTWSSKEDAIRCGGKHPDYIDSVKYEYTEKV